MDREDTNSRDGKFAALSSSRKSDMECVFLTCLDSEFQLAGLLRAFGIRVYRADTVEEADFLLMVTDATVLLADRVFLDGTWEDAARMLARAHPRISLAVIAEDIDERIRVDACYWGVSDLLSKPLRMGEFRRVICSAHADYVERSVSR